MEYTTVIHTHTEKISIFFLKPHFRNYKQFMRAARMIPSILKTQKKFRLLFFFSNIFNGAITSTSKVI